jgi:tetratricopeptide (TPR) repeat protein
MRYTSALLSIVVAVLVLAAPALASYGSKPSLPQPGTPGADGVQAVDGTLTPRQQADRYYRDAYDDVMKGSKDLANGKAGAAHKKFQRALEHSREAVELDSTRYEAWNLVGFTSRQLGDYPHSFEAYRVALRLKPDFALAREYYGEGLLETGDFAGALEQLAWLRRIGDAEQLDDLQRAVDRFRAAHPDSATTGAVAH